MRTGARRAQSKPSAVALIRTVRIVIAWVARVALAEARPAGAS